MSVNEYDEYDVKVDKNNKKWNSIVLIALFLIIGSCQIVTVIKDKEIEQLKVKHKLENSKQIKDQENEQ